MQLTSGRTACFSGYRPEKFGFPLTPEAPRHVALQQAVRDALVNAAEDGYNTFICGMSQGFDLICGDTVIYLRGDRDICADFRLIAAIPYEGFSDNWNVRWRDLYDDVYDCADEIVYTGRHYTKGCYFARNRFMVDNASRLICYWDGKHGGTAFTVKYAQQKRIEIINVINFLE